MKDRIDQALRLAEKFNKKDCEKLQKFISKLQSNIQEAKAKKDEQDKVIEENLTKLIEVHTRLQGKLEEQQEIETLFELIKD